MRPDESSTHARGADAGVSVGLALPQKTQAVCQRVIPGAIQTRWRITSLVMVRMLARTLRTTMPTQAPNSCSGRKVKGCPPRSMLAASSACTTPTTISSGRTTRRRCQIRRVGLRTVAGAPDDRPRWRAPLGVLDMRWPEQALVATVGVSPPRVVAPAARCALDL